jgi:hypothetical protein
MMPGLLKLQVNIHQSDDRVGAEDMEKKSPDFQPQLDKHQTFRLTTEEKRLLYAHAERLGVKPSTLLRSLITGLRRNCE